MLRVVALAVVALFAAQAPIADEAGAATSPADPLAETLYLGQYYPSGAIYLVPMVDAGGTLRPSSVRYVFVPNGVE